MTLKEKGCVYYKKQEKISNENATGTHLGIIMNECWETEEDFNNHNEMKHIQEFFRNECLAKNGSAKSWNVNLFK